MVHTPVCRPGESHGERSLAGYSPRGLRVRHDRGTRTHIYTKHLELNVAHCQQLCRELRQRCPAGAQMSRGGVPERGARAEGRRASKGSLPGPTPRGLAGLPRPCAAPLAAPQRPLVSFLEERLSPPQAGLHPRMESAGTPGPPPPLSPGRRHE